MIGALKVQTNDLVTIAVLGAVGWRLFGGLRRATSADGRNLLRVIVRGIRWRHFWPIPFVLAAIVIVVTLLVQLPGLNWGWWSAFGGQGNPVFGSNEATAGTAWEWIVPGVFMLMLLPALPLFAYAEERGFRTGAEDWSLGRRAYKVVTFGLIHAVIGIPIGAALGLSAGGAYFMWTYLRSYRVNGSATLSTFESTRAHAAYNFGIVIVVVIVVTATALS